MTKTLEAKPRNINFLTLFSTMSVDELSKVNKLLKDVMDDKRRIVGPERSAGFLSYKHKKAICKCGCVIDLKPYHHVSNLFCRHCGNAYWNAIGAKVKSTSWIKVSSNIDIVREPRKVTLRVIDIKAKVDFEATSVEFKDSSYEIIADMAEKDVFRSTNKGLKKATVLPSLDCVLRDNYFTAIGSMLIEEFPINLQARTLGRILAPNWGHGDKPLHSTRLLMNHPNILALSSTGDTNLLIGVLTNPDNFSLTGTNQSAILGLSNSLIQLAKQHDLTDPNPLARFKALAQEFDFNTLKAHLELRSRVNGYSYTLARMARLIRANYKVKDLLPYAEAAYDRQGLRMDDLLIQLSDYVGMSVDMGIVGFEKYPKSVRLAHDIAQRDYKVVQSEVERAKFEAIKPKYEHLAYVGKNHIIVLPSEPEDIVQEGKDLHHCVASYVSKMVDEESLIFFMRAKEDIGKALITIEVNPDTNRICQVKGFSDRRATAEEMDSVREWARAKGLKL